MKPDDPVSQGAERAIDHLNDDHADALLEMAQALGGHPDATAARCVDADRTGRPSGSPRRRGLSWAWSRGRSRPSSARAGG